MKKSEIINGKRYFLRTNRKPCFKCGTKDLNKKLPQEYWDGEKCWYESCFDCWDGSDAR